jgi:RNA polymerase sigma-70 factor, ECF subfamily
LTAVGADGARLPDRAALTDCILAVAGSHDRKAFAVLFAHFAPRVKSYLLRLGAAAPLAEDLAQETLLTVWRKAAYFDPAKAEAATWVFTIARNLRIDALRRERHPEPGPEASAPMSDAPPADEMLAAARREDRLRDALQRLPEEQREIVLLSYFQDKPHRQIERDLGIPLGTVKSRLRLALARLRAALGDAS